MDECAEEQASFRYSESQAGIQVSVEHDAGILTFQLHEGTCARERRRVFETVMAAVRVRFPISRAHEIEQLLTHRFHSLELRARTRRRFPFVWGNPGGVRGLLQGPRAASPPGISERVLYFLMPSKDGASTAGDLEEEFCHLIVPKFGLRYGRWWYRKQVFSSVWPVLRGRAVKLIAYASVGKLVAWVFRKFGT